MRKAKTMYVFITYYSQGVSHRSLRFADSKVGKGVGNLYNGKREDFGRAWIGGCWHGEDVGTLIRGGGGPVCILSSFWWVLRCKWGQKLGNLFVILFKSWLLGAGCYRSECSASWKGDWFPGEAAAGCRSEFYLYIQSGHSPFVYSVSSLTRI